MIFRWLTERRRARLLETPFPDEWRGYLTANVKAYRLLDEEEQQRLRDLVQVFIAEKHWEGCGGLELDDEMRVTIAGSACLMILAREHDLMREVESILVYPSGVMAPEHQPGFFDGRARIVDGPTAALGLAHHGGPVVLAWDSVLQGARNDRDGQNLVIHEMAHKIDFIDGEADGTPPLDSSAERREWADVCSKAFLARKSGEDTFLRAYAGTNEAEFFAVASEVFFEKPKQLRRAEPELYEVLRAFYKLDLAER
jgi:Mlc titration factor MtfA (ptsG expression regulator)